MRLKWTSTTNIHVNRHSVKKLLSGYIDRQTHTHTHTHRTDCSTASTTKVAKCSVNTLTTVEDRGQTDRITALPRPRALDSAAATGLGRATPHASPRQRAVDDDYRNALLPPPSTLNANGNCNPNHWTSLSIPDKLTSCVTRTHTRT